MAGRDANPVRQRIAYCHEILESLGVAGAAERVVLMPQDHRELTDALARRPPFPPLRPAAATGSVRLREPAATAEAIRVLADGLSPEGVVAGAGSPLGAVRVDKEVCTVCGTCATVCPAAAFAYEQTFEDVTLLLDPGGCVACGTCVGACPEHAITVEQATDLRALRRGRTVVKRGAMRRCARCGNPVAPAAMIEKIRELLPGEHDRLYEVLADLCSDCRGLTRESGVS